MATRTENSFFEGWSIVYQMKTIFAVLLIIAMAINLAVFVLTRFQVLVKLPPKPVIAAGIGLSTQSAIPTATQRRPAPGMDVNAETDTNKWEAVFNTLTVLASIVALVSVVFLVLCALLAVMLVVAGGLPGAGALTAAFFWAVALAALILPWCNLIPQMGCMPSILSHFRVILTETASSVYSGSWMDEILLWLRFVVYPLLIVLIGVLYFGRFNQANRSMSEPGPLEPQIK